MPGTQFKLLSVSAGHTRDLPRQHYLSPIIENRELPLFFNSYWSFPAGFLFEQPSVHIL